MTLNDFTVIFSILGSEDVKAARKKLMKLIPYGQTASPDFPSVNLLFHFNGRA